jgi:hypothetical protein
MTLDVPFARKVLEFARQEHDDFKFDMRIWWDTTAHWVDDQGVNRCGTAACLAGTAVHLHPDVTINSTDGITTSFTYQGREWGNVSLLAKELLGLPEDECDQDGDPHLFYTSNSEALLELENMITKANDA